MAGSLAIAQGVPGHHLDIQTLSQGRTRRFFLSQLKFLISCSKYQAYDPFVSSLCFLRLWGRERTFFSQEGRRKKHTKKQNTQDSEENLENGSGSLQEILGAQEAE